MTESKRRQIARQYERRVPLKIIAFRFGTTPQHVSRIALAEGCARRKGAIRRFVSSRRAAQRVSERMRRCGWSLAKALATPPRGYRRAHA